MLVRLSASHGKGARISIMRVPNLGDGGLRRRNEQSAAHRAGIEALMPPESVREVE
jgi:hypothetical protein